MNATHLLPVEIAAEQLGLSVDELRERAQSGMLKLYITHVDGRKIEMVQMPDRPLRKEDLPEYKKHAHLAGVPTWISQAARDFGIPHQTISKWVKKGIIRVLGKRGNKTLIDSADVAYCAEIYRRRRGRGRWLFDERGLPYEPRSSQAPQQVAA